MSATAVRDGDDYVLNGRRVFVGNSHVGELHFDNCRVRRIGSARRANGLSVAYSSSVLYGRPFSSVAGVSTRPPAVPPLARR